MVLGAGLAGLAGVPASLAQDDAPPASLVVVRGHGWGHGVGMSQYGALGRAAAGHGAEQILAAYYPGTTVASSPPFEDLRVSLGVAPEVVLEPTGPLPVVIDGVAAAEVPPGVPVRIVQVPGLIPVVQVEVAGVCEPATCVGAEVVVPLVVDQPVAVSTTRNRYHRGRLRIAPDGAGVRVAVDGLTMDQYLYGVAEMPSSWPDAALEAQAIAARTYAQHRAAARRTQGSSFDLLATTQDQVYAGFEKERGAAGRRWVAAVDRTTGRQVLFDGRPAETVYSSSNGGWSEAATYVFGGDLPYLDAAVDPWDQFQNPYGAWEAVFTSEEATRWLAPVTGDIGMIETIEVLGPTGASGRVDQATVLVAGPDGQAELDGPGFRSLVNQGLAAAGRSGDEQLRSTRFTVEMIPVPALSPEFLATLPTEPDAVAEALEARPPMRPDRPGLPNGAMTVVGDEAGFSVLGWAADPDRTDASVTVRVTLDGVLLGEPQADQASAYSPIGPDGERPSTGWVLPLPPVSGLHAVCAEAVDLPPGVDAIKGDGDKWNPALHQTSLLGCVLMSPFGPVPAP